MGLWVWLTLFSSIATVNGQTSPPQEDATVQISSDLTPDDVIQGWIEAMGGEMLLSSIETMSIHAKYLGGGTDMSNEIYFKEGKFWKGSESNFTFFDGEDWTRSIDGRVTELGQDVHRQYELHFDLPVDALRVQAMADRLNIELPGAHDNDMFPDCICLKMKDPGEVDVLRFFDPETYMLKGIDRLDLEAGEWTKGFRIYDLEYDEHEGITYLKKAKRTNFTPWVCETTYSDLKIDPELKPGLFDIDKGK